MRITRLEVFEIGSDDGGADDADGRGAAPGPGSWTALRIHTDDGLVGWGEGPPTTSEAWAADVHDLSTLVEGLDPRRHEAIMRRLRTSASTRIATNRSILAALDVALHDLVATSLDVPAYDLLGGLYRERIPVYLALPRLDPLLADPSEADLGRAVDRALEPGFRTLKLSLSSGGGAAMREDWIEASRRLVGLVRAHVGPDVGIIVDIGERPHTATVVRLARALEDVGITWLELGGLSPVSLRASADQSRLRLCHKASLDRAGLLPYFEAHATDIVTVSPAVAGLGESRRLTDLASHFDAMSSAADAVGPLGLLANVQSCAAMPGYEMMGIDAVAWEAMADVAEAPLIVDDGELIVPIASGIGASIREERLVPRGLT